MGIPETALHPQELPLDDHSVICLHSLTRLALPVITITRGCGCLIYPKQPCVVSIVTYRVTMGRTEIFKFDASTHHLRSCSSIHRTLVLRAIDFSRPFIYIYIYIYMKKISKKKHKKVRAPIKLTCHWRAQLVLIGWPLRDSCYLQILFFLARIFSSMDVLVCPRLLIHRKYVRKFYPNNPV